MGRTDARVDGRRLNRLSRLVRANLVFLPALAVRAISAAGKPGPSKVRGRASRALGSRRTPERPNSVQAP